MDPSPSKVFTQPLCRSRSSPSGLFSVLAGVWGDLIPDPRVLQPRGTLE
jgi:hypothetical protein